MQRVADKTGNPTTPGGKKGRNAKRVPYEANNGERCSRVTSPSRKKAVCIVKKHTEHREAR